MPDKDNSSSKYFLVFITGIVSLVVGVASALITNHLTRERLGLTYNVTSATFSDDSGQRVGIVAVSFVNSGKKEIESLQGQIDLKDALLTRFQHEGALPTSISASSTKTGVTFEMPFLNANEEISLQLLIEPQKETLASPDIDIRGKGIIGELQDAGTQSKDKKNNLSVIIAPLSTLLAAIMMSFVFRRKRGSIFSGGEQRDEFAYILGLNGFLKEATLLRNSSRDHTYWALSDSFSERLIMNHAQDADVLKKGVNVLQQTIEYGQNMAPRSIAIVLLNAARLAILAKESSVASSLLKKAREAHSSEVEERLKIDEWLMKIENTKENG
jgi:hypothetical protein